MSVHLYLSLSFHGRCSPGKFIYCAIYVLRCLIFMKCNQTLYLSLYGNAELDRDHYVHYTRTAVIVSSQTKKLFHITSNSLGI